MARNEAKVRVRLDTREARSDLRELGRDAEGTASRVGRGIRSAVGRGLGFVGAGAAIGAGVQAVRGATESGIGDVVGEAFGPLGAQLERALLGDKAAEARASRTAREQVFSAYAREAQRAGTSNPPGAMEMFRQLKAIELEEEEGRLKMAGDTRFFADIDFSKIIDNFIQKLTDVVKEGVKELARQLLPGGR